MALSELRISIKALAAFLICVLVIVATNAATFYAFPRYVTRTTVLAVPITFTTTSMSTTVSTATVISYWTVTTVSTTTEIPYVPYGQYGQYYWWQNPYPPVQFTTTETNWISTQSTIVIIVDPNPSITTTTQTITTAATTTTTTSSTVLTTQTQTMGSVKTGMTLSHKLVSIGGSPYFTVSGYLYVLGSHAPISGAAISLTCYYKGAAGGTYSRSAVAYTDSNGYFSYMFGVQGTSASASYAGSSVYEGCSATSVGV